MNDKPMTNTPAYGRDKANQPPHALSFPYITLHHSQQQGDCLPTQPLRTWHCRGNVTSSLPVFTSTICLLPLITHGRGGTPCRCKNASLSHCLLPICLLYLPCEFPAALLDE